MKKNYLLVIFLTLQALSFSQSKCEDANAYLLNAYGHVKDSYEANNISHLKYYANRTVESLELTQENLKGCDCDKVLELVIKTKEFLEKVDTQETYEDGRFYVKRGKESCQETVTAFDECTYRKSQEQDGLSGDTITESAELSDLENEQLKLKQQQEALMQKEAEIKQKLAEQQAKQLALKKKQLVTAYESALTKNIEAYNASLKACGSKSNLLSDVSKNVLSSSISEIKSYYNQKLKTLATSYLEKLDSCTSAE